MLYLFNNLEKLQQQVEKFKAKNPAGSVHKFDSENFLAEQEKLEELLASDNGLFGEQNLIILANLAELDLAKLNKEEKEELTEKVKNSATKVLWFEREVKKLDFNKSGFNIFTITDALGERDRGELWLASQQALKAGISSEEIFWKLVWQVKNMLLISAGGEIKSLKPFVVQKAKQFSGNFSRPELANLSSNLVRLWHETKREESRDFGLELEHFLLTI